MINNIIEKNKNDIKKSKFYLISMYKKKVKKN